MSEKNAKQDRKLQLVTEEADNEKVAKEMAESIRKMYDDRDKKAVGAKEHLVAQLDVTAQKYRTANGVMSALGIVRDVFGSNAYLTVRDEINLAKTMATTMAGIAATMKDKADALDPDEMDKLCDGFYNKEFSDGDEEAESLAVELMILQLCQNVGPSAQDIVEFIEHADKEIEKARANLVDFCESNGINFNELCGPHDNCHLIEE